MSTGHDSRSDRARITELDPEISKLESSLRILRSERDIIKKRLDRYPFLFMTRSHDANYARIADIDAEISKLEGPLRILRPERVIIWERLDQYPVLTLPNEIVSEIFLKFIPVYPSCPWMIGIYSPSHLMRICRQWRDIAQSTPQLWRAISTSPPTMQKETAERYVRLVKTWLIRSGSCPLSIQLGPGNHAISSFREDIMEAILPHTSHYYTLPFHTSTHFRSSVS